MEKVKSEIKISSKDECVNMLYKEKVVAPTNTTKKSTSTKKSTTKKNNKKRNKIIK